MNRPFEPLVAQEQQQAKTQVSESQQILTAIAEIKTGIMAQVETRMTELKDGLKVPDTDPKLVALEGQYESLKGQLTDLEAKSQRLGDGERAEERKSAGQRFVEDKLFTESKTGRGHRFSVTVEQKALTGANASAGLLVVDQRLPMFEAPTEPHIRDLIPGGETSSRVLTFPQRRLAGDVRNASMVAEGAQKPQSDFSFEMVTTQVRKIAHFVKASDEILEDAPALRSYIDSQLIDGLMDVEDEQILKGDGTGQNLLGLYTVATPFTRVVANDTLIDKLLRAQTQLRLVRRRATGVVLNPIDWEKVVLTKGTDSHYIWANVESGNGQRIWALPVRDTTALAENEWLVGDFRRSAQLFDRRQAAITVANQNVDDFEKNMVTILAEERLALVIYDRLGLVKNAAAE